VELRSENTPMDFLLSCVGQSDSVYARQAHRAASQPVPPLSDDG